MATWIDCPTCESHAMRGPNGEAWCTQDDCVNARRERGNGSKQVPSGD